MQAYAQSDTSPFLTRENAQLKFTNTWASYPCKNITLEAGMLIRSLSIAASIFIIASAQATETGASSSIDPVSNEFFKDLETGKIPEAWQFAFKGSVLASDEGLARAIKQTQSYAEKLGKISSWSKFKSVKIADGLERDVYYVEFAAAPVFFELTFYRHDNGWRIININMDLYNSAKTKGYFDDK